MKALAILGYILAVVSIIVGLILSTNGSLPMQGFSAVLAGFFVAMLFALPSTALIGIVQLRELINNRRT
jgi:hypothetical protein